MRYAPTIGGDQKHLYLSLPPSDAAAPAAHARAPNEVHTSSYFCHAIWQNMNEEDQKIWAVLEVRLQDVITLCDERKQTIESLTQTIHQMEADYRTLHAKYTDLLTAGYIVSAEEDERKAAKKRLSDLVRDVDKCLALLNG